MPEQAPNITPKPAKAPLLLVILDGWGHREDSRDNAIAQANTPVWDRLWAGAPRTLLSGSGLDVGLPDGQMGNSEVGHTVLGAGRVVHQSMTRIDKAIESGEFQQNPIYTHAIDRAMQAGGVVHIMGLLSPGGVHSHERHLHAAIRLAHARGAQRIYLHAFLDGRDTPPRSAEPSLRAAQDLFRELGMDANRGRVASIMGRYYAMDRDNRWSRTERAWRALAGGGAAFLAEDAIAALQQAYARGESDEFVQPTLIGGAFATSGAPATPTTTTEPSTAATSTAPSTPTAPSTSTEPTTSTKLTAPTTPPITDGDCVLFMNFRADRARQLTRVFLETGTDFDLEHFDRIKHPKLSSFVTTTEYAADIDAPCAFPPQTLANVLPACLAERGMTQLRIAETEKYAHVTFFFSGGREQPYPGEDRTLVPSPKVATYDLQPEMSAPEVTDKLVRAIHSRRYDLIVCNYANGDMVGHTGNFKAAVAAVEAVDVCLGRLQAALAETGGEALITADHGNCEQMADYDSGQDHTQHTTRPVPLVYVGPRDVRLNEQGGTLADVAPSLLTLLGLPQPPEMTGASLLTVSMTSGHGVKTWHHRIREWATGLWRR